MDAFLGELGKQLADRWLTILVLPGLLFTGVATAAVVLGQPHWNDAALLLAWANQTAAVFHSPGGLVLAGAGVLLASAAAGLVARGLSIAIASLWLGQPGGRLTGLLDPIVDGRRRRWNDAQRRYDAAVREGLDGDGDSQRTLQGLAAARNRISLAPPSRATWMGDRMTAAGARVFSEYRLDLVWAWPSLWLVLPDSCRSELREASARFDGAALLAAWGVLYAAAGLRWWVAALAGVGAYVIAWRRARGAIAMFGSLVEAAVDVFGRTLAASLGIDCGGGRLTRDAGEAVTELLRKGG